MRFKSDTSADGYSVYAVTGVHSVSFAIDWDNKKTAGLLGFSIERSDVQANKRYFMYNTKVFQKLVPKPSPNKTQSSQQHPVQSFVWDDFSVKPGNKYDYYFYPATGIPGKLSHGKPIRIRIETELQRDDKSQHDIIFNRGVASSQAYVRKFGNKSPKLIKNKKQQDEAYEWLSRELDETILQFIRQAKKGDSLYGCFYEFRYEPVAAEFAKAIDRGVNVKIIFDAKKNGRKDKKTGKTIESFPREDNIRMAKKSDITKHCILRTANKSNIHHNKFIVYAKGKKPQAVWTGSTNVSEGGIFGQTNVGHWVRNADAADRFLQYWNLLKDDPGNRTGMTRSEGTASNKKYKKAVAAIQTDIATTAATIPNGVTCIFSPRPNENMLKTYTELLDTVKRNGCVTLAFGVSKPFKDKLMDNTARNPLTLMLLEKEDKPPKAKKTSSSKKKAKATPAFVKLTAKNNVYQAFGSYLKMAVYQFAKETNTKII